jgi:bifunctional UDP-N-acetylglucosamine pyrophosphorylase / glucosamine-1-phosphate N-acetyltransferase
MEKIAAIILAAGKGKRMNSTNSNKVILKLAGKYMVEHAVDLLDELGIQIKIAVVGFAKESVMAALGDRVSYAVQEERLGTAHAVECALKKLPEDIETVLVLGGDDSAFYTKDIIKNLIENHIKTKAVLSLLTIMVENPAGLGRIIRNNNGEIMEIKEEKDATDTQRAIKEINPECYVFQVSFLREYLKEVEKSPATGEYYLTSLIDIAIKIKEKVEAVEGGKILWRGINTPEELREAEKLFLNLK